MANEVPKKKRVQFPIVLHEKTRDELRTLKEHKRETDNDVVERLVKRFKESSSNN